MTTTTKMNEANRKFVMDHMSPTGAKSDRLNQQQWERVYLEADGFGLIGRAFANEQCWDWSHVRDSSPEAIDRMARAIRRAGRGQKI